MSKSFWVGITAVSLSLGAFIGTVVPTPTDILHFGLTVPWLQSHQQDRWGVAMMSIFDWYFLDAIWYAALLLFAVKFEPRVRTFITVLSAGVVIGMVASFLATGSWLPGVRL